ncbi:MAG TPA: FRG domain-containing protein [Bryobacteraceae bacterium]|nr:FRG domain-containing protein [Bryobacteraceae bacterium]
MKVHRFGAFRELAPILEAESGRTFLHQWQNASYRESLPAWLQKHVSVDSPGRSGEEEVPKFLYRGEPGLFRSSLSSGGRLARDGRFAAAEKRFLAEMTEMAMWVWNMRIADPFRSMGWPQHYGFPTPCLDLTSDPAVALHFAASAPNGPQPEKAAVFRIDLEAVVDKVYGFAGRRTPLAATSIENTYCTRAERQRAWVICSRNGSVRFNLQSSRHLWKHIEKFVVDTRDASGFVRPGLLDAQDDVFASWPLAVLRSFKAEVEGAFPRALAEWICHRIPLYEWTPVEVLYDGCGRGSRLNLLSPSAAAQRFGRDYRANFVAVVDELTSPDIPAPNGILFGVPAGGTPYTAKWFAPGDECEVQWRYPFPGPRRYRSRAFERVILR